MKNRKRVLPTETATVSLISSPVTEPEPLAEKTTRYARNLDLYTVLALLIAAFSVRLYSLQFFHVISTDGTSYALNARAFAHGDFHGVGTSGFYPVLIAIADLFIRNIETAGRIVSIVFGSFLVLPLYLMGKSIFSRKVAIAASMIAIVWPSLVASSCEVMTQATHTTLQLSALYIFWRAFKKPTALNGSLAGIMIGLTYLTRPESILLFATMPLALLILNYRDLLKNKAIIASYSGSFLILFVANMFLVHHITGEWQLSAKTDSALNDALSYYLKIPDMTYIPGYEPKGYLDILKDHPGFILKNSAKNLKVAWNSMFPPLLWLFFAVGFFTGGFSREKNTIRLYMLSTLAPVAALIVFYYISSGYIEAYQPFMFLFAASGFASIEERIKRQLARFQYFNPIQQVPLLLATTLIYTVIIFAPQIRKDISDAEYRFEMDNGRRAEKHIGILLRNNLPPGKIMTRWARIAFYAEREWANIPAETEFEAVIKIAKESGVKYLIADAMLYSNRPKLGIELFEPLIYPKHPAGLFMTYDRDSRVKGLIPILLYNNPGSVGVIAYEIPS